MSVLFQPVIYRHRSRSSYLSAPDLETNQSLRKQLLDVIEAELANIRQIAELKKSIADQEAESQTDTKPGLNKDEETSGSQNSQPEHRSPVDTIPTLRHGDRSSTVNDETHPKTPPETPPPQPTETPPPQPTRPMTTKRSGNKFVSAAIVGWENINKSYTLYFCKSQRGDV